MPRFYPPIDPEAVRAAGGDINYAELAVLEAFDKGLDDKWRVFHNLHWREVNKQGEKVEEADVVVFHPDLGVLIIEIKGGGIRSEKGAWFQTNTRTGVEKKLDESPFLQARTSRFGLSKKLGRTALGENFEAATAFTYAAWFPDIKWAGPLPPDVPAGVFLLDETRLADPDRHLRDILRQANPHAKPWDERGIGIFLQTLAPEFNLLPPLGARLGRLRDRLFRMTDSQLRAFRALKTQKRLLVEGCAGSGKTLIASALAREHLQSGKRVLYTCYNRRLSEFLAREFEGTKGIDVLHFHELAHRLCEETGTPFAVPQDMNERAAFFRNTCPGLLLDCTGKTDKRYDTIIVDEAFDFQETWWLALESLGAEDFSFYAFYDRNQNLFINTSSWVPPFKADAIVLETNVRNTRPIGRFASKLGGVPEAPEYGVNEGPDPVLMPYGDASELPGMLKALLTDLTGKQRVPGGDIVVLSPYRAGHERLNLEQFLKDQAKTVTTDLTDRDSNKVRFGTIQSFKGLEANVVVLCGIDGHLPACSPANLYVGATRARTMLYVIHHKDFKLSA